jgi:hypothetical protein
MAGGLGTRGRFAVAYLVLGAAVGVGVGFFIVLLQRPGPLPPPPWSSWAPAASSTSARVLEIADHVGSRYKLQTGDPLVAVKVSGAKGSDFQGLVVLDKGQGQRSGQQYARDETAMFILCGTSKNCALSGGDPATPRGTVLRREALELALYTLEYAHPIDNVLIFYPPAPGDKTLSSTLFFRRDDLSGSLKSPLRKTLPQTQPPLPGRIVPRERKTVDDLTGTKLYDYLGVSQNLVVIQPPA